MMPTFYATGLCFL